MQTILLADDNKNIREYCRRELEDEGYRVLLASDGAQAVCLASRELLDLVILDICMPRTDGLEAVEQIRAIRPDVPIVFFTSFDEECVRDHRARLATACVEKREDLTELKRVIVAAMTSRERNEPYRVGLPSAAPGAENRPTNAPSPYRNLKSQDLLERSL